MGHRNVGYIRTEAEFEEIAEQLAGKESAEQKIHQLAIPTPNLLNNYDRKIKFINNNGLVEVSSTDLEETRFSIMGMSSYNVNAVGWTLGIPGTSEIHFAYFYLCIF